MQRTFKYLVLSLFFWGFFPFYTGIQLLHAVRKGENSFNTPELPPLTGESRNTLKFVKKIPDYFQVEMVGKSRVTSLKVPAFYKTQFPTPEFQGITPSRLGETVASEILLDKNSPIVFKSTRVLQGDSGHHVRLNKDLAGIPVFDEDLLIHFDVNNQLDSLDGDFNFEIKPVNQVLISKETALKKATQWLKVKKGESSHLEIKKVIYRLIDGYRFSYLIQLSCRSPLGDFRILVDAQTGTILGFENLILHISREGMVYKSNPLEGETVLEKLNFLEKGSQVKGRYCSPETGDGILLPLEGNPLNFLTQTPEFDMVNVYFHVSRIGDYFRKFGVKMGSIPCRTRVFDSPDNAFFSPFRGTLNFGVPVKLNNLSHESSVIYHEYSHAVTHSMVELRGPEGAALHEGYADYFACSLDENPLVGEYGIQPLGKPWMRNLENKHKFPDDFTGEAHTDGEIWGSACWGLRKKLGGEISDLLVHESRYYLPSRPGFKEASLAILRADEVLNKGSNAPFLMDYFIQAGFLSLQDLPSSIQAEKIKVYMGKFDKLSGE